MVVVFLSDQLFQMAQELGIVEKDENYVNPFKEDSKMVCSLFFRLHYCPI